MLGNRDEREDRNAAPVGASVAAERPGLLVVDQQLRASFTEGAFPYIRLEPAGGTVISERLVRDTRALLPLLRQSLAPGTYKLVSYQRPCEGACPRRGVRGLDPPALRCEAAVEIAAGERVTALLRPRPGRRCRVLIGKSVGPALARRQALTACRGIADHRDHGLRYWAKNWKATSTRPEDLGAAYAAVAFRGFEQPIGAAAGKGCAAGIRTVTEPIRFVLDDHVTVGERFDVSITNVGTRAYLYEFHYQACFLSYFDSTGRQFTIPPGTHCDIRGKLPIRPRQTKWLFRWALDECLKDRWGCVRSRPLLPATYTIKGRFRPVAGGPAVQAATTLEIVAA
jgi:hypothetical protein